LGKLKKIGIGIGFVMGWFFLVFIVSFIATNNFEEGVSEPEQNIQRTFDNSF